MNVLWNDWYIYVLCMKIYCWNYDSHNLMELRAAPASWRQEKVDQLKVTWAIYLNQNFVTRKVIERLINMFRDKEFLLEFLLLPPYCYYFRGQSDQHLRSFCLFPLPVNHISVTDGYNLSCDVTGLDLPSLCVCTDCVINDLRIGA